MLAGDFQEIIQDLVAVLRSDALGMELHAVDGQDRKSTRLNSSHGYISYAVFCLKKKKNFHTSRRTDAVPLAASSSNPSAALQALPRRRTHTLADYPRPRSHRAGDRESEPLGAHD